MITNKHNLPEVFVNLAKKAYKGSNNYTASSITKSVRQIWLERRHRNEIEIDVVDTLWALMGSAVHSVLESAQEDDALTEQYLKAKFNGGVFTGMADHYKDGVISDYKFTTVWSYIFMDRSINDHAVQLNGYKYLYEKAGFKVDKLQIVFIFRDWNKHKVDEGYPDAPVKTQYIPVMPDIEAVIQEKISLCEMFRDTNDNDLPPCTDSERWAKPSTWAVMKDGRKTAIRVVSTEQEAFNYISERKLDSKHFVTERKGDQYVRCEYCSGRQFCNQYNQGL